MRLRAAIRLGLAIMLSATWTSISYAKPAFDQTPSPMRSMTPWSEPGERDDFLVFLENLTYVTNINLLHEQGLAGGRSSIEPWAGSYWPTYQGLLGARYADSSFPRAKNFMENYSHFQSRPPGSVIASGGLDRLSPAEKYDLLVGDHSWALTRHMWGKGLNEYQSTGTVASWQGICHGWSGANHFGERKPERSVTVTDVTGSYRINFSATDVAALISYAWAETTTAPTVIAGNRCKKGVVRTDSYGRPLEPTCLDTNPMTWHLAITNKLGLYGQSFVMDSSSGSEVWNYPVLGYDYSYFNPRTFAPSHNVKDAIVPISLLTTDKFAPYRSPRAKYVVGIAMDVYYPALVSARAGVAKENVVHTNNFQYDLELDENYNVVGGEWYSNKRADFIWTWGAGSRPYIGEDNQLTSSWDITQPLPRDFASKATAASQRGKVLGKIVEAIHQNSYVPDQVDPVPGEGDGNTAPDVPVEIPETDGGGETPNPNDNGEGVVEPTQPTQPVDPPPPPPPVPPIAGGTP